MSVNLDRSGGQWAGLKDLAATGWLMVTPAVHRSWMTKNVDRTIFELAKADGGALSKRAALGAGLSESTLRRRVASGLLVPVMQSAYVVVPVADGRSLLRAAQLAFPEGAVSRQTAAAFLGSPVRPEPHRFVVGHGHRPDLARHASLRSVRFHETRHLPPEDCRLVDGLRVTSVPRSLCDLAPSASDDYLWHLAETALTARTCTTAGLVACVAERRRRGARGMQRLSHLLVDLLDDETYPESLFEVEILTDLRNAGIDGLVPQWRPPWYDGIRGVVDIGDPIGLTIVEADGRGHRQVTAAHDNDRARDRVAAAHGVEVLRVGYREYHRARRRICAELCDVLLARRLHRTGSQTRQIP